MFFSLSVRGVKNDDADDDFCEGRKKKQKEAEKKRRRAQKKRTTNKERGGKVDREEILTRRTNVHIQKKKNIIRVLYLVRSWKDLRRLAARDNNNNTFGKRAFSDLRATTTTS